MAASRLLASVLVAVPLLVGACTSDGEDVGSTATTAAVTSGDGATTTEGSSAPTPTEDDGGATTSSTPDDRADPEGTATTEGGVEPVGDTRPKSGPGGAPGTAQLVDVRTGRHDGFDRIVLEFAGGAVPPWWVEWIDGPITQSGSGNPVDVGGSAYLQIRAEPASGYDLEAGAPTFEPSRVPGPGGGPITEVVRAGDFEANLIWVAGAEREVGFTVSPLVSPARLVIDVTQG